ncbi:MAG TPA: alginate lyase family protein, partial [Candidatus Babeliaceae bacterium]|nr:alginate lyase family protein [Candidatus Babeliaceae bacterium]
IRFFIRKGIRPEKKYLVALHEQGKELQSKLEYHLLGNHLLENAFALLFTGAYLGDAQMVSQADSLLRRELKEQLTGDGAHFELSPMYHQLILYRLLDVINMTRASACMRVGDLISFLEDKASLMLGWMQQMSFSSGEFPLFNDAAYGVAPDLSEIEAYADRLGIGAKLMPLGSSGYRKWAGKNWEMFIDVGQPGPAYQPGHAHCDALSFVLHINGKPIFVDTGTSVYGDDIERRVIERSTKSHNTVQIDNIEQSELWGSFRMARKAKILVLKEEENYIEACHDGFFFDRAIHKRIFRHTDHCIFIEDEMKYTKTSKTVARFHIHPEILVNKRRDNVFCIEHAEISFNGANNVEEFVYDYAPQFGRRIKSRGIVVTFEKDLFTVIKMNL